MSGQIAKNVGSEKMPPGASRELVALYKLLFAMQNIEIDIDQINIDTTNIESLLQGIGGTQRTPAVIRPTGAGSVLAGKYSVAVSNEGSGNGTVLGATIKPGETFEFTVRDADTLGDIAYDATGTEFIILTLE